MRSGRVASKDVTPMFLMWYLQVVVVCSIVLFYHFVTMVVYLILMLVFISCSVMVSGFVLMFVVYLVLLNVVCS